jgi:hypothetical protein
MPDGDVCYNKAADGLASPFAYFAANGTQLSTGILANGVCVYKDAACDANSSPRAANGSYFACCRGSKDLDARTNMLWLIPFLAFMIPWQISSRLQKARAANEAARKRMLDADGAAEETAAPAGSAKKHPLADAMASKPDWQKKLAGGLMLACIGALVAESTIMPKEIQRRLSPMDRSAQLAMAAFLTPIQEVFAFLEDAMTIQVGYAIARKDTAQLNSLLHISVWGGAMCGAAAFLLMLALSASRGSAQALLNPSHGPNSALIAAGCDLVPTTDALLEDARVYWLLTASTWIPTFMSKGVSGFLIGTFEIAPYLFPIVVSASVPIGLWFGLLPQTQGDDAALTPITVLAIAYAVGPWLIGFFQLGYLYCNAALRKQYAITARPPPALCKRAGVGGDGNGHGTLRQVVVEGLMLMSVDLCVQLSLTITIYVAAHAEFEDVYKISALQAAYWTWGPNYLVGTMLIFKMAGAQLIASGQFKVFMGFCKKAFFFTVILAVAALVGGHLFAEPIGLSYGESACVFGAKKACAAVYKDLFVDSNSVQTAFEAFGPVVAGQLLFMVARAALSICRDFAFMARTAAYCFVLVYSPCILVAHYAIGTAMAYYCELCACRCRPPLRISVGVQPIHVLASSPPAHSSIPPPQSRCMRRTL